jgi:hypothetical protein
MNTNSMPQAYLALQNAFKALGEHIIQLEDTHRSLTVASIAALKYEIKVASDMVTKVSEAPNITVDQKSDLTSSMKQIKFAVERLESYQV